MYDLTDPQKDAIRWIVKTHREGTIQETFSILRMSGGRVILVDVRPHPDLDTIPSLNDGVLEVLYRAGLIIYNASGSTRHITILNQAMVAVDSDFGAPNTSFMRHLDPLPADISKLDKKLAERTLPILATGSTPQTWDQAVRQACIVLEERLRDVGAKPDSRLTGRELANQMFGENGPLAAKVTDRIGYRDIYAGAMGIIRNPSAHRFTDPDPEDAGTIVRFVDLLLKMLEDLREEEDQDP